MSNYFDQWPALTFIRQCDGRRVLASEALKDKDYLLLYFAPIWHGGTNRFTPKLRAFYNSHHEEKRFEVLYIARGSTQEEIEQHFVGNNSNNSSGGSGSVGDSQPSADSEETKKQQPQRPDSGALSSSPPSLSTAAPASLHGGYFALAAADMEAVAVPLLYHFRVFSYPSLMVLDNRPPVLSRLRGKTGSAVPFLSASFSPLENPEPQRRAAAAAAAESDGVVRMSPTDGSGRRRYTPRIALAAHIPQQLCLTGVFMVEKGDPAGEQFPWAGLGGEAAAGRRTFLAIAFAVLAVVSYLLITTVLPALAANDRARNEAKKARLAARRAA